MTCRWAALGLLFLGACVPAEPATPGPDGGPNDDATAPSEAASFDAVTPESDTTLDGGSPPDVTIGPAEASPNPEAGVADGAIMPEAGIADGSAVPEAGIADGAHDAARPEGGPPPDAGCLASDLSCSGACVPNDVRNCGFCGHDCTALPHVSGPVTCLPTSGACSFLPSSCAPGWTHCAANADLGCETDLSTMSNCGACGNACSGATPVCGRATDAGGGYGCTSGCPASTVPCGGACVDEQTDPSHCGSCTAACTGSMSVCAKGACVACTPGATQCEGAGAMQTCGSDGQWAAAAACETGCCSGYACGGAKPTWFQDADGDGYGTPSVSMLACTQPTGYVSNNMDCCDTDVNAHPGQTAFFQTADACGSLDYNCDGVITPPKGIPSCVGDAVCGFDAGICVNTGCPLCGDTCSHVGCAGHSSSYCTVDPVTGACVGDGNGGAGGSGCN